MGIRTGVKKKRNQVMIDLVGANIRKHREALGYSQDKFAVICDLEKKLISNYELSKVEMSLTNICIISHQLRLKPHELLIV